MAGSVTAPWAPAQLCLQVEQWDNWSNIKPGNASRLTSFQLAKLHHPFHTCSHRWVCYKAPGVRKGAVPKALRLKSNRSSVAAEDPKRKGDNLCIRNWMGEGKSLEQIHFSTSRPLHTRTRWQETYPRREAWSWCAAPDEELIADHYLRVPVYLGSIQLIGNKRL